MIPTGIYFLKVLLCSALLTGYYFLALRNKVFHQWNRFYLLLAVVLSLLVPLAQFTIFHTPEEGQQGAIKLLTTIQSNGEPVVVSSSGGYVNLLSIAPFLYLFVSLILLSALLLSLIKIAQVIRHHQSYKLQNVHFMNTDVKGTPFSFFRYIFWNSAIDVNSPSGTQILKHELVHVREWHTLDKLFMQAVLILFWYNPLFWIIRFELKMIHEFIADKKAVQQQDASQLAALILQTAYPKNFAQIINPFFHQSIKRRLMMLTKIQNPRINYVSRLFVLPLLAVILFSFSVKTKAIAENKSGANPLKRGTELSASKYQKEATASAFHNNKIATDTLPKKGEIAKINVKEKTVEIVYKNGTKEELSVQEAYRRNIININNKKASAAANLPLSLTDVLIIVDGEPFKKDLKTLNPNAIQSINVLKGSAAAKYGNDAQNGVIEITLKKEHENTITIISDSITVSEKDNNSSFQITSIGLTNRKKDTTGNDHGITFIETEIDPDFTGGPEAWRKYLTKNLNADVPVKNGSPKGTFTVMAQFIVAKDGSVSDVKALTKHGYGVEEEVIRIIKDGPKWKPAIQNGRDVKAYKKQPVTFVVTAN